MRKWIPLILLLLPAIAYAQSSAGFEVAYFQGEEGASKVEGCTTAVDERSPLGGHL